MDKCYICGSKDSLWYCYPIHGLGLTGLKLCQKHQDLLKEKETFLKLYHEITDSRMKGKKEGKDALAGC